MAVGNGAAGKRGSGKIHRLVLLRLRTRLPRGTWRLCARGGAHSIAAALCFRRVVVALLGLQRPGAGRIGARLPRKRYAARRAGDRYGLALEPGTIEGHGREGSVGLSAGLERLHVEQDPVSRSRCVPEKCPRRRTEDHDESASRVGHSAVGRGVSGNGARHGDRPGNQRNTSHSIPRTRNGRRTTSTSYCARWKSRAWISGGSTGSSSR